MSFKKVAILTSRQSWFVPYAKKLVQILKKKKIQASLFFRHQDILESFEVVFILSYFRLIEIEFLKKHKHNLVVHESDLPKGRGWAPLFWQILEGKNKIPIVLFEATDKVDAGKIYLKDYITLEGHELHNEIREKQAKKTLELCLRFIFRYKRLKPKKQKGSSTFCRRTPEDSKLDIYRTLKEQFNLLRIVNNDDFPAFLNYKRYKYILKIYKAEDQNKCI